MALKDQVSLGTLLPHRSPDPLPMEQIRRVAQRAEALGFRDLWVTENTLDDNYSLDPFVILTYAAAVTRSIRLGVAVVVLPMHNPIHIAHQALSLDHVSGGRFTLGVALGPPNDFKDFQVPMERRVKRFIEGIDMMKALWAQPRVDFQGEIYRLSEAGIALRPVQQPHPPLWMGGTHPDAIKRAVRRGDAWIGGGAMTEHKFFECVTLIRETLDSVGRDSGTFGISKRIFLAVDHDPRRAEADMKRWFTEVYGRPHLADESGIFGTPEQVRERIEPYVRSGATHLLLNSVSRYEEQLELLAEVAKL